MGVIVPPHLAVVVTVLTALREEDTVLMQHHSKPRPKQHSWQHTLTDDASDYMLNVSYFLLNYHEFF